MTVRDLVYQTALNLKLDPDIAVRQATAESDLNPAAVSPAGAIGVMQLMPATAAGLHVDPRDVYQNIRGGLAYMRALLEHFGAIDKALAAYNWGPGHLTLCLHAHGADWLGHCPAETQRYVARILAPGVSSPRTSIAL